MPPAWKDGDEVNPGQAKKAVRELLDDPKHKRAKGHPDDELTRDDPLPEYGETPEPEGDVADEQEEDDDVPGA